MITFSVIIVLTIIAIRFSVTNTFQTSFARYVDESNQTEFEHLIQFDLKNIYTEQWDLPLIKELGIDAIRKGIVLRVHDNEGNEIWNVFQDEQVLSDYTLSEISENMQSIDSHWNDTLEDYEVPIVHPTRGKVGEVHISRYASTYYMDNDMELFNSVNRMILFTGFISIVIVIVLSAFISKSISNPISKVSTMAKRLATGHNKKELDYKSHLKEVNELISSINKLSRALNEQEILRKELTTDIAHELRTPLTTIKGHLDLMIVGIWKATPERLQSISEEVTRISQLVDELRHLARFDQQQVELTKAPVSLVEFLESILYNFQAASYEKEIHLKSDLIDTVIIIDTKRFSQVIINLLSNAIKYTPLGGVVSVSNEVTNQEIKIIVSDNGMGIPEEELNHIFERFYRVDNSHHKEIGGIGVGLAISKSIVESHDGKIEVKSQLNKGSQFIITLPK